MNHKTKRPNSRPACCELAELETLPAGLVLDDELVTFGNEDSGRSHPGARIAP